MNKTTQNIELQITQFEDRGLIGLSGGDARNFLQNLISNDVNQVNNNHAIYSLLLTPQGKFLYDFMVIEISDIETGSILALECSNHKINNLVRLLTMYKLHSNVGIHDLSARYEIGSVFGQNVAEKMLLTNKPGSLRIDKNGGVYFIDPRIVDLGARVIFPKETFKKYLLPNATIENYESHRIGLGVPDGNVDLETERTFPLEAGLEDLNAIDYNKGCYIGQELTARTHYRGTIRKRIFPVLVDGPMPKLGTVIFFEDKEAGVIKSSSDKIAIAMLRLEFVEKSKKSGVKFFSEQSTITPLPQDWMKISFITT